jgi:GNAT superfamily N-acetyltransferase
MTISPLRERPEFADTLADRAWHAWWTDSGVSLAAYRAHLDPMMEGDGIPLALVAHEGGTYVGSVLLVESDLDARPQLAPWIAALWVEPDQRRQGIAARLIEAARAEAKRLGHASCFLCATPDKAPYYVARGFGLVEADVDGLDVFVI